MEPIFLLPVIKDYIWGGTKLRDEFHYDAQGETLAECWGISAHPNGDCKIIDMEGETLSNLWKTKPELFGKTKEETNEHVFPLLVKIIDAKNDLSIQVHPEDCYAKVHEDGSFGKTECWYILDCEKNAELVLGHTAESKDELKNMIENNKWSQLLQTVPVKKGDFFQINPGTIHAIKGGITLLETQQNSDITYRVYDYGRLSNGKPRELHIDKSVDVITVPAPINDGCVIDASQNPVNTMNLLYQCDYYKVFELKVDKKFTVKKEEPYLLMTVVEGEGNINGVGIKKGDNFIVTSETDKLELTGDMSIIASAE